MACLDYFKEFCTYVVLFIIRLNGALGKAWAAAWFTLK